MVISPEQLLQPAKTAAPKTAQAPVTAETKAQATPIRGAALKIVENMEASLRFPTATLAAPYSG